MRVSISITCFAVAVAALGGCQGGSPQFAATDESTTRAMFDSTVVNIRAGNWAKWSEQFSDNAVLQPPNAPPVTGRAAILAWGQAFPPIEDLSFSDVQVTGDGNMAWGSSGYVLKVQGQPADTGKQLVVFRRRSGGTWEIPAVSFSSNLPAPAPAPATGTPKQ
jgi:ketosteroid isomerase-like protein